MKEPASQADTQGGGREEGKKERTTREAKEKKAESGTKEKSG